ncbi:DEKNAAC104138 [Brettanomyces naardenensis]|uniref:DEKNAAC104138 n=1 Tax=Brettanomyces naardenensis TaxID=13370 RepID=A0A448YPQ7_BRENA|nr:DEKNAAC104138 [Brettanomyces naardenensis]
MAEIRNTIAERPPNPPVSSLVSIDVGLRNFSLSRFTIPKPSQPPILLQWCKLNLPNYSGIPESPFNPQNYAQIVNKTLSDLVLLQSLRNPPPFPNVIVIERQRFRTNGARNVHESILKSNAIEYMLFASIETFRNIIPGFNPVLVSSSPQTMTAYWEDYYEANKSRYAVSDDTPNSKLIRMLVVDEWLRGILGKDEGRSDTPFRISDKLTEGFRSLGPEALENRLHRYRSVSRRIYECMSMLNEVNEDRFKVELDEEGTKKGDDVTDSLLHGLTYLKFEENKGNLRAATEQLLAK